MPNLILPFTALFIAIAFLLAGNGAFFTLLPLHADANGFSDFAIGLIGAVYYAGFIAGCFTIPWLIRRASHIRTFAALASLAAVFALLFPMTDSRPIWWLLRIGTGFCLAGLYMTVESWLNGASDNASRGRVFAIYAIINLGVFSLGQFIVAFGDPAGAKLFSFVAILFCLSILPLMVTVGATPALPHNVRVDVPKLFSIAPVGAAGALVTGFANGGFWAMGPVYALAIGFDVTKTATFMALVGIGAAIAQWPWGLWSDRIDRRHVILMQAISAAIFGLGISFLSGNSTIVLFLALLFGAASMPLNAISIAHVNDQVPVDDAVAVSGALNLLYGLGAIAGPIIAAVMMGLFTPSSLFVFTAIVHLAFTSFLLHRLPRRAATKQADKEAFVAVPNASPEAYQLDPRGVSEEDEPQTP